MSLAVETAGLPGLASREAGFAVRVERDFAAVETVWRAAEAELASSPYQIYEFAAAWAATLAHEEGAEPAVAIVRDEAGRVVLVVPFAVTKSYGLRIAGPAGGKHVNYGHPMFAPGVFDGRPEALRRIFAEIAVAAGVDLFVMPFQPSLWRGAVNPLLALDAVANRAVSYHRGIPADPAAVVKTMRGNDGAGRIAKKERRLSQQVAWRFLAGDDAEERQRILVAFLAQKCAWLRERGLSDSFCRPAAGAFFTRMARETGRDGLPVLQLFGIEAEGRVIAAFGGGAHQGRFGGALLSYESDGVFAKYSLGEILLKNAFQTLAARGVVEVDLGVGVSEYKERWLGPEQPLSTVVHGHGILGRAAALVWRFSERAKTAVKRTPRLERLLRQITGRND